MPLAAAATAALAAVLLAACDGEACAAPTGPAAGAQADLTAPGRSGGVSGGRGGASGSRGGGGRPAPRPGHHKPVTGIGIDSDSGDAGSGDCGG